MQKAEYSHDVAVASVHHAQNQLDVCSLPPSYHLPSPSPSIALFLTQCSPDSQSTSKNYSKIQRDVQQKKATVDSAMKVHEQNTVRPSSFIVFLHFSAADRMPISICLLTNAFCFLNHRCTARSQCEIVSTPWPSGYRIGRSHCPSG